MKEASVTNENRRRFVWLRICLFISLAWTAVFGGFVVTASMTGQGDIRYIQYLFTPSRGSIVEEWATSKIELMKKEFGRSQETTAEFRLRMYENSTDDQIVNPTNYSIPWPSRNIYDEFGIEPSPPKGLYERLGIEPSETQEQTISEPYAFDLSTAVPIDENENLPANSRQSLISNKKHEGRWLDLARQDEAIDNAYLVKLEWAAPEFHKTLGMRVLQEISALWLVSICSIFALGAIFNLPWFSHNKRTIRVRRRLALSASIMWVVLMVPISIVWELGNELPPASLAAAFLCPLGLIWLCYVLWSWTLRE